MTRPIRKWQRAQITKSLVSLKILVLGPMLVKLFLLVLINTTCYQNMWPYFFLQLYTTLSEKYPTFFLRNPGGFQWSVPKNYEFHTNVGRLRLFLQNIACTYKLANGGAQNNLNEIHVFLLIKIIIIIIIIINSNYYFSVHH